MKRRFAFALVLVFLFGFELFSAVYVGKVIEVKKRAYAKANGKTIRLGIGSKIYDDMKIITKKGSRVIILFTTGSKVTIYPNSIISINKIMLKTKEKRNPSVGVLMGFAKLKIKKIVSSEKLNVNTPTAVVGVRGTEFLVGVAPDGCCQVQVIDGVVNVKGERQEVSIKGGEEAQGIITNDKISKKKQAGNPQKSYKRFVKNRKRVIKRNPAKIVKAMKRKIEKAKEETKRLSEEVNSIDRSDANKMKREIIRSESKYNKIQNQSTAILVLSDKIYKEHKDDKYVKQEYEKIKTSFTDILKMSGDIENIMEEAAKDYYRIVEKATKDYNDTVDKATEDFFKRKGIYKFDEDK